MLNTIRDYLLEDVGPSPGSIAGKIKFIRQIRGLTQQQLGIKCGFSDSSAYVRIGQYESGKKTPRKDAIKNIANALDINEKVLFDGDLSDFQGMAHALFDIEDFHGLHPVKVDGEYYLKFSSDTDVSKYNLFLEAWDKQRTEATINTDLDTKESIKSKLLKYAFWRYTFPEQFTEENQKTRHKRTYALAEDYITTNTINKKEA